MLFPLDRNMSQHSVGEEGGSLAAKAYHVIINLNLA